MAGTGSLRTYLGTAPGAGTTFAMLAEGRRRAQAGLRRLLPAVAIEEVGQV